MEVDDVGPRVLTSHKHGGGGDRWREREEDDSKDDTHRSEGEAVHDLLAPQPYTAGSPITGTDVDEEHSVPEPSNTEGEDDDMGITSDEQEITAAKGRAMVQISLTLMCLRVLNACLKVPPPREFP